MYPYKFCILFIILVLLNITTEIYFCKNCYLFTIKKKRINVHALGVMTNKLKIQNKSQLRRLILSYPVANTCMKLLVWNGINKAVIIEVGLESGGSIKVAVLYGYI